MTGSLFSPSWYKVANIAPRLRSHVQIHRRRFRAQEWYLLQDHATGKFHRFSPEAYAIVGLMDGQKTLSQIWEHACAHLDDAMPTQDEVIGLLAKLYRADVLQTNILQDAADLFQRYTEEKRSRFLKKIASPTSIKIPLFDPDAFLNRTIGWVRPIFSTPGMIVWLAVVIPALVLSVLHWPALTEDIVVRVLSLENLVLIGCIYPFLKLIHEFAHAWAVKRWGGEVHEMGIMLLVFVPIPYVDASSATAFADKGRRMLVGGAGILAEVFLAAVAFLVWMNVSHGDVRTLAYNIMIIAAVSTLFFNGNPLLRFDAYYILSDFMEIPNLGGRANAYIGYLFRKYIAGLKNAVSPADGPGEPLRFGVYAVLSFIYRVLLTIRIILWLAAGLPVVGVLLAAWSGFAFLVLPLIRAIRLMVMDGELMDKQKRVFTLLGTAFFCVLVLVFFLPLPHMTVVQGVAWPPERAAIHAEVSGFVQTVAVHPNQPVLAGDVLMICENAELETELKILSSRHAELKARYMQVHLQDRTEARIIEDEIAKVEEERLRAEEKTKALVICSPVDGIAVLHHHPDLPGRFLRRGDPLGFVLDASKMTVKMVVPQSSIQQVVNRTKEVNLKTAGQSNHVLPARVTRFFPAASRDLPSMALSIEGGGNYALDPRNPDKPRVMEPLFQVELAPLAQMGAGIGERVYIRFRHAPEPLFYRFYRQVRRVLLRQLDI